MKIIKAATILGLAALLSACTSNSSMLPADIYKDGGTPSVTAHSTTRQLFSEYKGPLYQIQRVSDGKTLDIGTIKGGYADAAAHDEFSKGTLAYITIIYDQSGLENHLTPAPPGTFLGPDKGGFNTSAIADMAPVLLNGHKVYGVYIIPGMGYRCNNAKGLAINDEPEGMYYVIDGSHYSSGCCFDYGNSSTNGRAVGTGTMETTYYGTATAWGSGNGEGPWIMADMEAGLFSGYNAKKNDVPSITDWNFVSVYVNGGGGNQWDLRGADANTDSVITFYSGVRPGTPHSDAYYPMNKKGAMLLGNGGDNGNGSAGTFFEGIMTVGYPIDDAINAIQKNIAQVNYSKYPITISRIQEFAPGESGTITVNFSNTTTDIVKGLSFSSEIAEGWTAELISLGDETLAPGESTEATFKLTAPEHKSSGFVYFYAEWAGKEFSARERIRSTEAVKINEVYLSAADRNEPQFIELYNADQNDVDLSGMELIVRRSAWDDVKIAEIPEGTIIKSGDFYVMGQSEAYITIPAKQNDTEIYLSGKVKAGDKVIIKGETYTIKEEGIPASPVTTVFSPISTGPKLHFEKGTTLLPVTSAEGFAVGDAMAVDLGGNYESFKVTAVGTAATQTTLEKAAKPGDEIIYLAHTADLTPDCELIINTGYRIEKVKVAEVIKQAVLGPARRPGQPMITVEPGEVRLTEAIKGDHMNKVDVSCTGTGIAFEPATVFEHNSADAIQALGKAYKLSSALKSDVDVLEAVKVIGKESGFDNYFGYELSYTAGSIALVDPQTSTVMDAIVYGSQQSSSSANGTIASPELATIEGLQTGGGCIAVVPPVRMAFRRPGMPAPAPVPSRSLARYPDGSDLNMLCVDFKATSHITPGKANEKE